MNPRLFLTSMCGPGNEANIRELVGPVIEWLDGVVWALNDCPLDDPGAVYLESVKGCGRIIHRPWSPGRHNVPMNDTLYCGGIEEGDWVLYVDAMERPMPPFVSRIATEIGPMMQEADLDVIYAWGKAYLMRYRETMVYMGSPHWWLSGHNGRGIEWSKMEPDETKVRFNARPLKRQDEYHWVRHYLSYLLYPAGTNHALLGLDTYGDPNVLFPAREQKRLAFRWEMKRRGFPVTVDGFVAMCQEPDEALKEMLRGDKVWSDAYHHLVLGRTEGLVHSHKPTDALPIL